MVKCFSFFLFSWLSFLVNSEMENSEMDCRDISDIYVSHRMNPAHFGDPLTLP